MDNENRMQISRHWRLNSFRYRLAGGIRYPNGEARLPSSPRLPVEKITPKIEAREPVEIIIYQSPAAD